MKAVWRSFLQLLSLVRQDMMLLAACIGPILAGLLIRIGIPKLEQALTGWLDSEQILVPYYGLIDLFYSAIAAILLCFAAAMVILEERDDHIEKYLFVTSLGQKGYIASRIFIPAVAAFILTLILLPIFHLSTMPVAKLLGLSATGTLQGVIIALSIVTFSSNKLEGMAVTKMATVIMLGAFVPYFVRGKMQYAAAFLPSFWAGKGCFLISAVVALLWIGIILRIFLKKMI